MLDRVRPWVRSMLLRRRLEREMQEEMAEHIERSTARLVARGLPAEEARREALREFGNVACLQEEARDARGWRWLDALAADLRFALRQFARRPLPTVTMFVVLAVGMSISTLLFSYVHSYAVQPPPGVALDDDLVRIRGSQGAGADGRVYRAFSDEEFLEYRRLGGQFSAVAGWTDALVGLDVGDDPERSGLAARVSFVTENYFPVLGLRPVLGPGLPAADPGDPSAAAVAVIGYATWERVFGRSPDVIGSTVAVNGVPVTVVGVAPERFIGMGQISRLTLWMPLASRPLVLPGATGGFRAAARLRPGVGRGAATAAAQVVAARAAAAPGGIRAFDPATGRVARAAEPFTEVVPLLGTNGDPMFERDVRLMSLLVGLLGLLVLLVTCTNVSALLTGLATARRQEIAVRLSLGAARSRLVRQLLTESALLAFAAAAGALGIVWLVLRTVVGLIPEFPLEMGINWPVTLFTFGVALAVGVLFGLSPALHATRLGIAGALRDSSASIAAARARLQRGLVVAQIAFTQPLVVLLAAVLLLVFDSYQPQGRTESADRLARLTLQPATPITGASRDDAGSEDRLRATMQRLAGRLRDTPGVAAAVVDGGAAPELGAYTVHPDEAGASASRSVVRLSGARAAEGYFGLMGIPVLRGRELGPRDAGAASSPDGETAVVIGADLARRLWAGADPIGRRLSAAGDSAGGARTLVVVGVVRDPRAESGAAGQGYRVFLPPDTSQPSTTLLLRSAGAAGPLVPAIHQLVRETAPGTRFRVRTLAEIEDEQRRSFHLLAGGVSAAGLLALLLAAIGLYAVVALSVSQRTAEIAVRIAVGARTRQIVRRFVGDGLRLCALGLAIGLPVGLLGLRALLAADDTVRDVSLPVVTMIAALGVVLVATAAAWIPARRAASVDPAVTLRCE